MHPSTEGSETLTLSVLLAGGEVHHVLIVFANDMFSFGGKSKPHETLHELVFHYRHTERGVLRANDKQLLLDTPLAVDPPTDRRCVVRQCSAVQCSGAQGG